MEDMLKGRWKQMKGEIQKQWGKLTDDELAEIEGNQEKLIGKIQEKYGYTREKARMEVDSWMRDNDIRRM